MKEKSKKDQSSVQVLRKSIILAGKGYWSSTHSALLLLSCLKYQREHLPPLAPFPLPPFWILPCFQAPENSSTWISCSIQGHSDFLKQNLLLCLRWRLSFTFISNFSSGRKKLSKYLFSLLWWAPMSTADLPGSGVQFCLGWVIKVSLPTCTFSHTHTHKHTHTEGERERFVNSTHSRCSI